MEGFYASFAVISITLALVFYTVGVWGEKLSGELTWVYLGFFWAGFVFDTTGTTLMTGIAGGFEPNLHGLTGLLALVLMILHAGWATLVLVTKNQTWIKKFHRFSLTVWGVWLGPYLVGMALNIRL